MTSSYVNVEKIVSVRLTPLEVCFIDKIVSQTIECNSRSAVLRHLIQDKMKETDEVTGTHWVSEKSKPTILNEDRRNMFEMIGDPGIYTLNNNSGNNPIYRDNGCIVAANTQSHSPSVKKINPYVRKQSEMPFYGRKKQSVTSSTNQTNKGHMDVPKHKETKIHMNNADVIYTYGQKPVLSGLLNNRYDDFPIKIKKNNK